MKLTRRRTVIAAIAVAAAGTGWLAFRPKPVEVETSVATLGPFRVTVDEDGETRVQDRYVVTAPVTGRLERIALREGAEVSPRQVVARIAPVPLDAQAATQAQARLVGAQAMGREAAARVAQAQRMVEDARLSDVRTARLTAAGAVAERDREQAALSLRIAEDELRAALARSSAAASEVQAARATLLPVGAAGEGSAVRVTSPVAGRVLAVPDRSERVVAAGTPILEIGDASALEIVIDVLSTDAVEIVPGAEVEIAEWGGERVLAGRVRTVGPAGFTRISALGVEEQRVNVVIDLVEPMPSLGDGFRVEARVVVWAADSVLTVPASAVVRDPDGWTVFTVVNGRAEAARVEIGHRTSGRVEIVSGVQEGARVILFPSDQIVDGVRVRRR